MLKFGTPYAEYTEYCASSGITSVPNFREINQIVHKHTHTHFSTAHTFNIVTSYCNFFFSKVRLKVKAKVTEKCHEGKEWGRAKALSFLLLRI
jgi:hypothetical protein